MSYYKMERKWMDSAVWRNDPYDDRAAWCWMIGEARYEAGHISVKGLPLLVKRGQLYTSVRFMAEKFQWSKDRVQRYLDRLKKWGMIAVDTATGQNLITVCNYDEYQGHKDAPKDTNEDTDKDSTKDAPKDKQEEIQRNSKKVRKTPLPPKGESPEFKSFWDLYPKQRIGSRTKARKAYEKAINEKRATAEEIENGVSAYRISDEVGRGFAKGAAAWLNDDRWANSYKSPRRDDQGQKPSYMDRLKNAATAACQQIDREAQMDANHPGNADHDESRGSLGGIPRGIAYQPAGDGKTMAGDEENGPHEEGDDWLRA